MRFFHLAVCSVPKTPNNGFIVSTGPYFIGSSARFACEEGYGIDGDVSITCLAGQTWNNSSPDCERRLN